MMYLYTGQPGNGKTNNIVSILKKITDRPLYAHGVRDFKLPHTTIICEGEMCKPCQAIKSSPNYKEGDYYYAHLWHEWAPENADIFLDEVQHIYRPRSAASATPKSVQAFETHRHDNINFYLATQNPRFFDFHVRTLVNKHIHFTETWAKRYQIEWKACKEDPTKEGDGVKTDYKLDKSVFGLYKSAEDHTKTKRKIPMSAKVFPMILATIGVGGFILYQNMVSRFTPEPVETTQPQKQSFSSPAQQQQTFRSVPAYLDYQPTIRGVPESAPAYSEIVKAKTFPVIVGCFSNDTQCTCYTQQSTVYPTTLQQCLDHINGHASSFNPYLEDKKNNELTSNGET